MSRAVCHSLGLAYDPMVRLDMQSANSKLRRAHARRDLAVREPELLRLPQELGANRVDVALAEGASVSV